MCPSMAAHGSSCSRIDELIDRGRLDEAEARLRAALDQSPEDPELYVELGECLLSRGDRDAAMDAFVRAIDQGGPAAAYRGLGRCERQPMRRYEAFAEAVRRAPGCLESELGLAESLIAMGHDEPAIERLWALVLAAPGQIDRAAAVGDFLVGAAHYQAAARVFERAIDEHPIDEGSAVPLARAYRGLARALSGQGRAREATEALHAALYLDGGDATDPSIRALPS